MKHRLFSNDRQQGFTLVELVLVIIMAGLLATYALPRFFNSDSFEDRGFYTEDLNAVRYAQQLAVAINCATRVQLTANTYTVTLDNDGLACDTPVFGIPAPNPVTGQPGFNGISNTVIINPTPTIQFTALGTANADVIINVGGLMFRVHGTTGYIEELQ